MSKHTPAPWTIQDTCREYNGDLMIVAMEAGDNGTHVCQVTTSTKRNKHNITPEQDANATLIAAAPELLAALLAALPVLEAFDRTTMASIPQLAQARASIAKATGAAA